MAATESKIKLIFDGVERGVVAAAAKSKAAIKGVNDENNKLAAVGNKAGNALVSVGAGLAKIGAAGSAVQTVGAAAGAVAQLAPAALLLPGALLAGAAAMTTFKIATSGFGEAVGAGLSGDLEAFAEATKKMHPEMAKAAGEVVKFKPRIDDLKKSVQGRFWDQFSVGIKETGTNLLDMADKSLPALSQELGNISKRAVNMLGEPAAVNDVREVLDNTTATLRNMRPALANTLSGFLGIAGIGATKLPRLGTAIDGVTAKFKKWVDSGVESGRIDELIENALTGFKDLGGVVRNVGSIVGSVFRGLGTEMSSPLASLRELTGQVAAFLETAEAQEGLKSLGETLRVIGEQVGRVVMTALRELTPVVKELAPVAREVAVAIGDFLVDAIETVGPLLRDLAGFLSDNKEAVGDLAPLAAGAVLAIKGFQVASKVAGWVSGASAALETLGLKAKAAGGEVDGLGKKMDGAGRKGGISWGKGFVGGLGLVGVGVGGTLLADALIPKDVSSYGSQAARDMLGEMAAVFSGEGQRTFQALDVAKWISNPIAMGVEVGSRELQKLFGTANTAIPPMKFDVDTGPGQDQIAGFMNSIKGQVGTVDINGRTTNAAQALADIIQQIGQGAETVTINGQSMPAQEALNTVIGLINNGAGMVDINGNKVPAGQALASFISQAQGSRPVVPVGANTSSMSSSISSAITRWNGYTIRLNGVVSSRIGGMASGGPVVGPGTGTSDTAGIFALSHGEYVATARQVDNAGGPAAFGRLMAELDRGPVRGLVDGGAVPAMRAAMRAPAAAGGSGTVRVELHVTGGADSGAASWIAGMVRRGQLQIKVA